MSIDFGALRETNLKDRPFVKGGAHNERGRFPFPLALIQRRPCGDEALSSVAMRLFHTLHFLSWNCFDPQHSALPFQAGGKALRRLVGQPKTGGNHGIRKALGELQSCQFALPDLEVNGCWRQPEPLLASSSIDSRTGRVAWRFSEGVVKWCRATTPYAWLELAVISNLQSSSGLRLYELAAAFAGRQWPWKQMKEADLREFLAIHGYKHSCDFRAKVLKRGIEGLSDAPFTMKFETVSVARDRHADFLRLQVQLKNSWTPKATVSAAPLDPRLQSALLDDGGQCTRREEDDDELELSWG